MSSDEFSTADRIAAVLDHLGLEKVHVAACMSGDWGELVSRHPDRIRSLTVVTPHLNKGVPAHLDSFAAPVLVITGDQGAPAERARDLSVRFRQGNLHVLRGYASPAWADTIADNTDIVTRTIDEFLAHADREAGYPVASVPDGEGEVSGVSYSVHGHGPPLILLPLTLAPSQWTPLIERMADRYRTILLGGRHLGAIALLEGRASSAYGELVAQTSAQARLVSGTTVLEIGCGSGALARDIARRTDGRSQIVATDLNPYFLSEARKLAAADELSEIITFEQADGEALCFPDAMFDVCLSCTVLEEGNADLMLAELARVTKAGGRIITITRAIDIDWYVNVPVSTPLRKELNAMGPGTGAGVGDEGCADASLYDRLMAARLKLLTMGPQFATYRDGDRLDDVLDRLFAPFTGDDAGELDLAARRAKEAGTLFVSEPFHCAVSRK